jgi:ubiquinone/menaquinone biosynthesis C-methylase UbiE
MTIPPPAAADLTPAERNARLFDAVADTYDDVGVEFFGPIGAGLLRVAAPRPGESLLDLGCGKGAVALPAASAVGESGRVLGLDVSLAMLGALRERAAALGVTNLDLTAGDASDPQLAAGAFDVVTASLVIFFLPDPLAALTAWRRLLAPGGRVAISTFGRQDEVWRSVDDVFAPYLPPAMLDARTSGAKGPFGSDAGVERLCADAGLTDVRTQVIDLPVRFEDADHWEAFSRSTGQRAMWTAVPEPAVAGVRAEAHRRVEQAARADAGIVLHQQVRYTLGVAPTT